MRRTGGRDAASVSEAPLARTSWTILGGLASILVALIVTIRIYEPDFWQHLVVGKAIWHTRQIPHTMLWIWPTYGQPDVLPSWLFRALLWPFWAAGGFAGLQVWRGMTSLVAFALLWAAARAAGARGPWTLVALVWCALFYRSRAQIRPETLVAVLLAAQLWVLERRRAPGSGADSADPALWLVPIALVWANAHISYYLGLLLTAIYLADAWVRRGDDSPRSPKGLLLALLACGAVSFVNPFGWRALAQPFEYFFVWRHEPIYQHIDELHSIDWSMYAASFLPVWLGLLVVLALLRARRRGFDLAQWLCLLVFIPQALTTQRFLGFLALIVAPTFARDIDQSVGGLLRVRRASPRARAVAVGALMLALPLPSMVNPAARPSLGVDWQFYPVAACDWIETHGVRGRALNDFPFGGYILWRFWPQRDRLPFMDTHQDGTPADRYRMAFVASHEEVWRNLDAEHRFDWVLAPVPSDTTNHLLDYLDADPRFGLVFCDDVSALYLRRDGVDSSLAARTVFRWLPAGAVGIRAAGELVSVDSVAARGVRAELERRIANSSWNGDAYSLLANLDLMHGNWAAALDHLQAARRVRPSLRRLAEREQLARDSLSAAH